MRKIIVHCDNSKSVGCDSYEALLVDDNTSEAEIDDIAFQMSCQQAEGYFEIVEGMTDEEDEIDIQDIEATWEDYNPEVHDMYRTGGGSFEDDFAAME